MDMPAKQTNKQKTRTPKTQRSLSKREQKDSKNQKISLLCICLLRMSEAMPIKLDFPLLSNFNSPKCILLYLLKEVYVPCFFWFCGWNS